MAFRVTAPRPAAGSRATAAATSMPIGLDIIVEAQPGVERDAVRRWRWPVGSLLYSAGARLIMKRRGAMPG